MDHETHDTDQPETLTLFGGAVSLGRAIGRHFPARQTFHINWKYYSHQAIPLCPDCGALVGGLSGIHYGRRKLSKAQRAHEQFHEWLNYLSDLLGAAPVTVEGDEDGTTQDDSSASG